MKKVFVARQQEATRKMFRDRKWLCVNHLDNADLVVLTGGADVNPKLYNHDLNPKTRYDNNRDEVDMRLYVAARKLEIPMAGICRGGQFLNVMNGGELWQHADGHSTGYIHSATDHVLKTDILVTSTHHQIIKPTKDAEIIATAKESTYYEGQDNIQHLADPDDREVEVCWYEDTSCLCFQPHPEYQHKPTEDYFFELLERFKL